MKLSVLIPAYNEEQWIADVIARVLGQKVDGIQEVEVIVVDDASTDQTVQAVKACMERYPDKIVLVCHEKNKGKGGAIRSAVDRMTGDLCLIQDADLEYSPEDYTLLLRPMIEGFADCVFGSRFAGSQHKRVLFFWHYMANKALTLLSNMCTNLNLTDMETGYKAFRVDLLKTIPIRSERFGFEPEITAKVARRKARIYEVGISYCGRTYADGKKITWVDGLKAVWTILKYRVADDSRKGIIGK